MTDHERAKKVFSEWVRKGIHHFEYAHLMRPEEKEAIIGDIANAIEEAVEEALYERDQSEWCKDK